MRGRRGVSRGPGPRSHPQGCRDQRLFCAPGPCGLALPQPRPAPASASELSCKRTSARGAPGDRTTFFNLQKPRLGSAPHPVPPTRQHACPARLLRSSSQPLWWSPPNPTHQGPESHGGAPAPGPSLRKPLVPGAGAGPTPAWRPPARRSPAAYLSRSRGRPLASVRLSRYSMPGGSPACGAHRTRGTSTRRSAAPRAAPRTPRTRRLLSRSRRRQAGPEGSRRL